jgi:predicted enzyme related to lactoylglutathione lyase
MSTRDSYPAGVPCWVETLQADTRAAAAFYEGLMGWTLVGSEDPGEEHDWSYLVARRDGADVAGIGALPDGVAPSWVTHVRVDSAEDVAERVRAAGGAVLDGPLDPHRPGVSWFLPTRSAPSSAPGRPKSARERSGSTSPARGR